MIRTVRKPKTRLHDEVKENKWHKFGQASCSLRLIGAEVDSSTFCHYYGNGHNDDDDDDDDDDDVDDANDDADHLRTV